MGRCVDRGACDHRVWNADAGVRRGRGRSVVYGWSVVYGRCVVHGWSVVNGRCVVHGWCVVNWRRCVYGRCVVHCRGDNRCMVSGRCVDGGNERQQKLQFNNSIFQLFNNTFKIQQWNKRNNIIMSENRYLSITCERKYKFDRNHYSWSKRKKKLLFWNII